MTIYFSNDETERIRNCKTLNELDQVSKYLQDKYLMGATSSGDPALALNLTMMKYTPSSLLIKGLFFRVKENFQDKGLAEIIEDLLWAPLIVPTMGFALFYLKLEDTYERIQRGFGGKNLYGKIKKNTL